MNKANTSALIVCICGIGCSLCALFLIITDGDRAKDGLFDDKYIEVLEDFLEPTTFEANVSAYCPCEKCCGRFADGITASGAVAEGFFVAAPPEIPFGTLISIPGYAGGLPVPVLDRGGAIKGNKLDVFFSTHQEALNWGRQKLLVRLEAK